MSEMGHCRDCRWWDANGRPDLNRDGHCERIGWGVSLFSGATTPQPEIDGAIVIHGGTDDDDGNVCLMTGPDFGCVQFEAKR